MTLVRSNVLVFTLLAACSKASEPTGATVIVEGAQGRADKLAELTAEELVKLNRSRVEHWSELSESERAALAEYDHVLERIMKGGDATWPTPDATKPCIVTRDYELWVLPSSDRNRYTVKDHDANVLADRIDEERLRSEFSYLHNLLHPEYLQFYDVVGY